MKTYTRLHSIVRRTRDIIAPVLVAALPCLCLMAGCGGGSDTEAASAVNAPLLTCDDSMKTKFRPDDQTKVLLVKAIKKGDDVLATFPDTTVPLADYLSNTVVSNDICVVKLVVGPGNAGPVGAPSTSEGIGIEIMLPTPERWNKRLHVLGGGDYAGGDHTKLSALGATRAFPLSAWGIAADEGAVSASTDTGHFIKGNGSFAMNPDGTINSVLWKDYSSRAIHEMALKAKALSAAFYGTPAAHSYWHGISTGGRQALKEAQVNPADFDGIIAGMPAINITNVANSIFWPRQVILSDLGGIVPSTAQISAVSMAAVNSCDLVGGVHVGYPQDASQCRYDPTKDASLLCASDGGANTTSSCLSAPLAKAFNKMWYGQTADGSVPDPAVDNGFAFPFGSLHKWGALSRGSVIPSGAKPSSLGTDMLALELQNPAFAQANFVNATGNGSDLWKQLNYVEFSNAFDRAIALQPNFDQINTADSDLSAFKARGGKLVMYHGLNDSTVPVQGSIDYYNRVASVMGGNESVQGFMRFYLVPGLGHGWGQVNGTANRAAVIPLPVDQQWYSALTDWVEKGIAPGVIPVSSLSSAGSPTSTNILCVYPKMSNYLSGDPSVSASYSCS